MELHPLITLLAIVATIIILLYKYLTSNYGYWESRKVPFLPPSFPFGNFKDVIFHRASIGKFLQHIYESSDADTVGFWIFNTPHLVIRSPELIKNVLVKDFNSFSDRTIVSDEDADMISSKMLLTVKNPEWKIIRNKVSPIFTTAKLKNMTGLVVRASEDMVDYLKGVATRGPVEVKEFCSKFTTNVITSCVFGLDANCFEDEDAPFRVVGRQMFVVSLMNGVRFISYFLVPSLVKLFKISFFDPAAMNFLRKAFWDAIKEREASQKKRHDLIDIIIQLRKEECLTDGIKFEGDRVVAQAVQFYTAGFETSSTTLSFMLYELAFFTEIQQRARDDVQAVIEKHGSLNYESISDLKYIDKVIAETLRKYPSLPFLDRRCMQDYKIPDSNIIIEKGTAIFIPMLGLHYDEHYFPNPEVFDPERFAEENSGKWPTYAYLPFGHGPHNCIGERFAMISAKLSLAYILMNFTIETCAETPNPIVYNPGTFVVQPLGGLHLNIKRLE